MLFSIGIVTSFLLIGQLLSFYLKEVQMANAICIPNLSGKWTANDGATYYIQQNNNRVWWAGGSSFSSGTSFTNVFDGNREGDNIKGLWADVPLGNARSDGELSLQCSQDANNDILTKTSASGGFGGSIWEKPKDVLKKTFAWHNLNKGDCLLHDAYLNLYSNGKGVWHADISSDSNGDSWVVQHIILKDANGNQVFNIPKFSSATLLHEPLPFATGPGPQEDKNRIWNMNNIQFDFNSFDRIASASMSSSC